MGRVFLITLGFHEDRAVRRLVESSATRGDRVYLLTASRVPAVLRAYDSLAVLCRRLGLPDPELVEVPADLEAGIGRILEILGEAEGELVVDLSGGMRYVSVYTLVALFLSGRSATIYVQPEGGEGGDAVVPGQLLEVSRRPPGGLEMLVLEAAGSSEGATVEELSAALGRSAKTVSNAVSRLSRAELVARRGRRGGVFLTPLGRLVLKAFGGRR